MANYNIVNDTAASRLAFEQLAQRLWELLADIDRELKYYQASGLQFSGQGFTGALNDPEASNGLSALAVLVTDTNYAGYGNATSFNYRDVFKTNIAKMMRRGG
jgi:hypothetical protein